MCCSSWHLNVGRGDSESILSALLNIPAVMIFAGVARNDRSFIVRIFDTADTCWPARGNPITAHATIILCVHGDARNSALSRTQRCTNFLDSGESFSVSMALAIFCVSSLRFPFLFPSSQKRATARNRSRCGKANCITLVTVYVKRGIDIIAVIRYLRD